MSATTHTFTAGPSVQGQRLDRVLTGMVDDLSRSRIKALIESGQVTVDDDIIQDPNHRLRSGARIALTIPAPQADRPAPQSMPLDVRYEDEHLIVLNKPAGLVVHPAPGNPDKTLVNALLAHCGESLQGIGGVRRPGIVHRLDKDTSGLLVAAKTEAAHTALAQQFADHTIERRYVALVWGVPSPLSGTVVGAIGRSTKNRKKMTVVTRGGKDAVTHYTCKKGFGTVASRIECRLETGRTHQIRVHMSHLGHSIIGDPLYGRGIRRGTPKPIADAVRQFDRQALHAGVLGFIHPALDQPLRFEVDTPADFQTLEQALIDLI